MGIVIFAAMLTSIAGSVALAAEHALVPSPQTVHWGHFSAAVRPVLTIQSADTVSVETPLALDLRSSSAQAPLPQSAIPDHVRAIYREVTDRGPGPQILVGPIFIEGAMPGDVLELRLLEVELGVDYGMNTQLPSAGTLPDEVSADWLRVIRINRMLRRRGS